MKQFRWPVRVYYEDTDAGGVVYYANYLKFMERARTEWLRERGYEQDALMHQGIVFVVRRVDIDYNRPARFNQLLDVLTTVSAAGPASVIFKQQIVHEGINLAEAVVKLACLDIKNFRPKKMPDKLFKEIKEYINVS